MPYPHFEQLSYLPPNVSTPWVGKIAGAYFIVNNCDDVSYIGSWATHQFVFVIVLNDDYGVSTRNQDRKMDPPEWGIATGGLGLCVLLTHIKVHRPMARDRWTDREVTFF